MNIICEYIKYLYYSKGKHQIHSPFVFDFITNCLKINIKNEDYFFINNVNKQLKNNQQLIEINDFGQGSKKLGKKRKVSEIHKNAASKGVYAKLLYQLVQHYSIKNVLEFGTSLGVGSLHLALGNRNTKITTIDACLETQSLAKIFCNELPNITFFNSTFLEFLTTSIKIKYDLIFIDGHHNGDALINYLELLDEFSHDETIFVLDDIRWSNEMLAAWNKICENEKYHLSLDLFRMGIILKRKHQNKEHFLIKLNGIINGML